MKKPFTLKSTLFTFLAAFLFAANSFGQTAITTGTPAPATVCAGGEISVPFTTTGVVLPTTTFSVQLSDEAGVFTATPVQIGTGTESPITATIPPATTAGADYKIRVVSVLILPGLGIEGSESALKVNAIPAAPTVTSPVIYTQNATPEVLKATGTGLLWYEAATGGTGSNTAPTPATTAVGSKSYFVSQTAGGCESERAEIVVTVSACTPPDAPTVANLNYTIGEDAPVLTATPATGLLWYTAATGGNGSPTAPKPSTTTAGKTSYFVSRTVSNCESARAEIVVTVTACTPPDAPTVSPVSYELNATNAKPLEAKGETGATFKWYATATSTTPISTPTPSTKTEGKQSFFVTQTVGGCESARSELVVTISACTPPAAPAVSNLTYTVGDDAKALSATPNTGLLWYSTATGGTGTATAPIPSTTTPGTKSYWVSRTVNNCESARAELVVTVTACVAPSAPVASNVQYCINEPTVALTATGTGLKWYTTATGGTGSTNAPKPSSAQAGVTSYWVSRTVGVCESGRTEIKVTITETAKPQVASAPVVYCLNETASQLTATGTSLKWYTTATGGTGSATAPTPLTNTATTRIYYVTQTANGCESERASISVEIRNPSLAPTVPAALVNLCQNSTAKALTATGTALKWYSSATGGTALSGAPVPVTTTVGTTSYYVSQTQSGLCESPRTKIDVVIKDTPVAPTVTATNYCVGETAEQLTPSGGVYKWYLTFNGGEPMETAPTPKTTTAGTTPYYLTQSNTYGTLSCESPKAKKDVIVNPTPATVSALSEAFCQERQDKNYVFPTQATEGNTLNWYTAATGGTPSTTRPNINLKNAGETTFFVTQVTDKKCESRTRVAQKVRVKPLPAIPATESALIEYCQLIKAEPLKATAVSGAVLNWFGTDATGGTPSGTAPTPSTETGGTTSYYVAQTLEGCIGDRAKIDVKINTTPKPTTTNYLEYCQGDKAPILDATGTVLKWYRDANTTEWQGFPFTPFTDKVQDYSFYVTQTGLENKCESPKEEIKIHIKSLPSATISGNSTIDLGEEATITLRFTGDGPWKYVLSNGDTATTSEATHQVRVRPGTTTGYLVTDVSNECGPGIPSGLATVTVRVPTISTGNPSVAEACAGKSFSVPFQQSGDFPAENTFKVQIAATNEDAAFYTIPSVRSGNSVTATFPDTTEGGSYFFRVVSSGPDPNFLVKGSVSQINIAASPLPVATLTGTQTILIGEKASLKIETTGRAPWTFTITDGVKDTTLTANATPFNFQLAPKTTATFTIKTVTNACGTGTGAGSARVQVDPILGVEPQQPADWAKVYPTVVANSICIVEVNGVIKPREASIEVIDLNGITRGTQPVTQKLTEVDFNKYPSGLYLLRIQNGRLSTVQRVMKP